MYHGDHDAWGQKMANYAQIRTDGYGYNLHGDTNVKGAFSMFNKMHFWFQFYVLKWDFLNKCGLRCTMNYHPTVHDNILRSNVFIFLLHVVC